MMSVRTTIEISGAKQNNLKNVSIEIPRDKITVITGVSGSGKSSLAFDVLYGEAQRRFLDSISNYAKGRIGQVKKPKVDYIKGLSPVVAIEQKKGNHNPRSTIGTVTDINDFLRLLFATAGKGQCPACGFNLSQLSAGQMAERIANLPVGTVVNLSVPIYKPYGEEYSFIFNKIRDKGFRKVSIDGVQHSLSSKEKMNLDETKTYDMRILIDRFTVRPDMYIQIAKSIDAAMLSLEEELFIQIEPENYSNPKFFEGFACPEHHFALCEMQPFHFSFNTPASACGTCSGVGTSYVVEPRFLIINPQKSIMKGALKSTLFNPSGKDSFRSCMMYSVSEQFGFSLETPFEELPQEAVDVIFYGSKGVPVKWIQPPFSGKRNWLVGREWPFGGFVNDIQNWYRHYVRKSMGTEVMEPGFINDVMVEKICPECDGARLKKQRLQVLVGGKNIDQCTRMQIPELMEYLTGLTFEAEVRDVSKSIVQEMVKRLQLLLDIGLYYLSLARRSDSVSGGEMQRIKMSTQISSELMGMLYVMDEPSIGLHMRDAQKVIHIMERLRDIGNTVVVVEHDMETMRNADYLIEVGPGPGIHGGNIVAEGTYSEFVNSRESITAAYLSGEKLIEVPNKRRQINEKTISICGAYENNLQRIDVKIPLQVITCVTGVSGSGKSTLINEILFKQLEIVKKSARIEAGRHENLTGHENISSVINIDQSPIGRGNKSNPATYVGVYDKIRDIYASTDEAVARGYRALDFSLTHANGCRCEHCTGDGVIVSNLQFMADIESVCPVCKGMRFSQEGTEIKYRGKSIADVLDMTVEEALSFFSDIKYLKHKLGIMNELGLGYITLGQRSSTLSGGEAQRVKLAYELAKMKKGTRNLYILDEPTTGLHMSDIGRLLDCLNRIVDGGHTCIIIEHNLDVIKCADHIIDLGPEGGKEGGLVVACGTPEEVARCESSYTGRFLKTVLV